MNWVTLIGRLGMVILMTGLAVGLISLIPPARLAPSTSSGFTFVQPEKYSFFYLYEQMTPQSGVRISIVSNSSVNIYILGISMEDFENWTMTWVTQQFPNIPEYEVGQTTSNVTVLNAFLESHSGAVLWKSDSAKNISKEFYPDAPTNATAIIANPSPDWAQYTYEIVVLMSIAPKTKGILLTEILIPVGAILAVPWVYLTRTRKPKLE